MGRPRSDIRQRLLRAARRRFLADGVDGASLRRIARDARSNIGMIYYYFPTKDALFDAVVEEIYGALLADLAAALAPEVPVDQRVHRLFVRLGQVSRDEVEVVQLVVRELLVSSTRRGRLIDRFLRGHIPLILGTVAEGVRTGALTDRQPFAAVALSIGSLAIFPQVIRRLAGDRIPAAIGMPAGEALSHALADLVLGGVAGRGTAS